MAYNCASCQAGALHNGAQSRVGEGADNQHQASFTENATAVHFSQRDLYLPTHLRLAYHFPISVYHNSLEALYSLTFIAVTKAPD